MGRELQSSVRKVMARERVTPASTNARTRAHARSGADKNDRDQDGWRQPVAGHAPVRGASAKQGVVRVSVVIPTLNEAKNLPYVFTTLPSWLDEVILVDGNSVDDTVAVAQSLRGDIRIVGQSGYGKGNALIAGFSSCTGDIIVMLDADGSMDGAEIEDFVAVLENGADFAKGSRFKDGGGSTDITRIRRWGNRLLSMTVNVLFGTRYTDLCYGYNAFWARHLDLLQLDCAGFEVETLMNIRIARAGLKVEEVSSYEHSRIHGVSNLRVLRTGSRITAVIAREWVAQLRTRKLNLLQKAISDPVISAATFDDAPSPEAPAS